MRVLAVGRPTVLRTSGPKRTGRLIAIQCHWADETTAEKLVIEGESCGAVHPWQNAVSVELHPVDSGGTRAVARCGEPALRRARGCRRPALRAT